MLDFQPESKRTDVKQAVEFLSGVQKRRTTAFILSDFYVREDFQQSLQICSRKHDVVAIQVYDVRAKELPDVGLMKRGGCRDGLRAVYRYQLKTTAP